VGIPEISEMKTENPTHFVMGHLLRDAGNYKTYGEVLLLNDLGLTLAGADAYLRQRLIDGAYFYASKWGIASLEEGQPGAGCETWYEYEGLEVGTAMDSCAIPLSLVRHPFGHFLPA
jgi:hypothetical protein